MATLAAAVVLFALTFARPPATIVVQPSGAIDRARAARTVAGAIHVHTNRSDGTGTVDAIAAAAARAGLKFVVFTDHGDGTRAPDPPQYRSGILCVDGVEISTTGGHCLAIGMGKSPYRLAGEPRDVVEDVQRLGGLAIAAHPGSNKAELMWRDWNVAIDGLEWINTDSEWRDERRTAIAVALAGYLFRGPEAVATLLDRPTTVLDKWDQLIVRRRVFAIAGADAHARISLGGAEPIEGWSLPLPSYETTFRVFSNRVVLERPLTGHASLDAAMLLRALRAGHVFTTIDALAAPGGIHLTAATGTAKGEQGDTVPLQGSATIQIGADVPAGARIALMRAGEVVAEREGGVLSFTTPAEPAAYRAEVRLASAPGTPPVPWLVGNPVYLRRPPQPIATPEFPAPAETRPLAEATAWRTEHDEHSSVVLSPSADGALIEFALAGGVPQGQYAAAVIPIGREVVEYQRLAFTASTNAPARVSVQLRRPHADERWRRSIFLESTPRVVRIPFDEFVPVSAGSAAHPDAAIDSLLVVVDLTNNRPGDQGWISISGLRVER